MTGTQYWTGEHTAAVRTLLSATAALRTQTFAYAAEEGFDAAAERAWPGKVRAAAVVVLNRMAELEALCPPLDEHGRTRRPAAQWQMDKSQNLVAYAMRQLATTVEE